MGSRHRAFVFTLNNPVGDSESGLLGLECQYVTFGREIAPGTGTPHLQGFIYFANGRTVRSCRQLLRGAHVERAITIEEAIDYCHKGGDFVEKGQRPTSARGRGEKERLRWEATWDLAKKGDVEGIPADIRVRLYSSIRRIEKDYMVKPINLEGTCGFWLHGPSGVGKTHSVYEKFPELYTKNASKNWDGYQGEEVVLFDDIDPDQTKWCTRFIKIWADRYPFIADNKGGSVIIRPKKFVVTSQYAIEQLWLDAESREAISRRFTVFEKRDRDDLVQF